MKSIIAILALGAVMGTGVRAADKAQPQAAAFDVREALKAAAFVEHKPADAVAELEGKKLIGFYFTAKWCGPCRAFTPKLVKFRNEHSEDFQFVMMSWDKSLEEQKAYLKHAKMETPAVRFDDPLIKEVNQRFRVGGVPTLVLFDGTGKLITTSARMHLIMAFHPDDLAALGDSEGAKLWREMIAPSQAEYRAERDEQLVELAPVFEKYQHFAQLKTVREFYGYANKSQVIGEAMAQQGRDIAADWDNLNGLLDELPSLAKELKPDKKGYRGILEVSGARCFDELGKAAVKNPEVMAKLWQFLTVKPSWAVRGIVNAAVAGDQGAFDKIASYRDHIKLGNAPLTIFPAMAPACRAGDERALDLAFEVYQQEPYYVYAAFPLFLPSAYQGNTKALDAMAAFSKSKNEEHARAAREVIGNVAAEGSEYARKLVEKLDAETPKEETTETTKP